MKTIQIRSMLLLILLGWAIVIHAQQVTPYMEGVIAIDITDSLLMPATAKDILACAGIEDHKWESYKIRTTTLAEYEYNATHSTYLPERIALFSNPIDRDKEITQFKQKFTDNIKAISEAQTTRPQSSIYKPLIREVNKLAASKAPHRLCFVFSDCRENNPLFTIYRDSNRNWLSSHPIEAKRLFMSYAKPVNLKGIFVYFIFKSGSQKENVDFLLMVDLFKQILTDAGATVFIGANLDCGN